MVYCLQNPFGNQKCRCSRAILSCFYDTFQIVRCTEYLGFPLYEGANKCPQREISHQFIIVLNILVTYLVTLSDA